MNSKNLPKSKSVTKSGCRVRVCGKPPIVIHGIPGDHKLRAESLGGGRAPVRLRGRIGIGVGLGLLVLASLDVALCGERPPFTAANIRVAEPVPVRKAESVEPRVIHVYHVHNMHQNYVNAMWPALAERINNYQEHVYNYIANFEHAERPEVFVEFLSEEQPLCGLILYPNIGNMKELVDSYLRERDPVRRKQAKDSYRLKKEFLEAKFRYLPGGDYRAFKDGLCELRPAKNKRAFEVADKMAYDNLYRSDYATFLSYMEEKEDIALDMIAKHATHDHVILVYGGVHDFGQSTSFYRSHIGSPTMTTRNNVAEWNRANRDIQFKLHNINPIPPEFR